MIVNVVWEFAVQVSTGGSTSCCVSWLIPHSDNVVRAGNWVECFPWKLGRVFPLEINYVVSLCSSVAGKTSWSVFIIGVKPFNLNLRLRSVFITLSHVHPFDYYTVFNDVP
jgi:hypothetical protein